MGHCTNRWSVVSKGFLFFLSCTVLLAILAWTYTSMLVSFSLCCVAQYNWAACEIKCKEERTHDMNPATSNLSKWTIKPGLWFIHSEYSLGPLLSQMKHCIAHKQTKTIQQIIFLFMTTPSATNAVVGPALNSRGSDTCHTRHKTNTIKTWHILKLLHI